jgi:hypothetical protein
MIADNYLRQVLFWINEKKGFENKWDIFENNTKINMSLNAYFNKLIREKDAFDFMRPTIKYRRQYCDQCTLPKLYFGKHLFCNQFYYLSPPMLNSNQERKKEEDCICKFQLEFISIQSKQ